MRFMLCLVLPALQPVFAAEPVQDHADFARRYTEALAQRVPGIEGEIRGDLRVEFRLRDGGSYTCCLDNARAAYGNEPARS